MNQPRILSRLNRINITIIVFNGISIIINDMISRHRKKKNNKIHCRSPLKFERF
ncbi:hypothetical protein Hanom_Chr04g00307871 [Helianthus anomalus]